MTLFGSRYRLLRDMLRQLVSDAGRELQRHLDAAAIVSLVEQSLDRYGCFRPLLVMDAQPKLPDPHQLEAAVIVPNAAIAIQMPVAPENAIWTGSTVRSSTSMCRFI